jgi:RNA polymerase sigma-70 factor (ECF subfamily)
VPTINRGERPIDTAAVHELTGNAAQRLMWLHPDVYPGLCVFKVDQELARRLLAGDERAFRRFMDQYAQRLAAFVTRRCSDPDAVEDLVQNTLIRAVRALDRYRAEASLFTWLCQIACSEIHDQQRRTRRRVVTVSLHSSGVSGVVDALPDPEGCPGGLPEALHDEPVLDTLRRLPLRYARVLEWKYGDDASVEEIGRLLGVGATAAQSLLARARTAFRAAWESRESWRRGDVMQAQAPSPSEQNRSLR